MEMYCWSTPNVVYMWMELCNELQGPAALRTFIGRMRSVDSRLENGGKTENTLCDFTDSDIPADD